MTTEMISQKPGEMFGEEVDVVAVDAEGSGANADCSPPATEDIPTYADAFPPLSSGGTNGNSAPVVSKWNSNNKMSVKSSNVTQFFCIPFDKQSNGESGSKSHASGICKRIAQQDNVSIEISQARDESLTLIIVGKPDDVAHARKSLVQRLQTQVTHTVKVPKDVHRFILGAKGVRLSQLELKTSTRIQLPHRNNENCEDVVISGSEEGVRVASEEIEQIRDQQALVSIEKLPIKRNFQPFICGANNKKTIELAEQYGVRISQNSDEIIVSGEKEKVNTVKQIILTTYENIIKNCDTVDIQIEKAQHRYLIGARGRNLNEILEETGVSVEMPPQNSTSETVRLRGERLKLGAAISAVYSKANSVVTNELEAPSYLHRLIIGKKGENVKKITENLPNVHIDFEGDMIKFEGAPEQVIEAREELEKQLKVLNETHAYEEVDIDRKHHPHIVGKAGSNVNRLKNEYNVNIRIPHDNSDSNTVIIEGDPKGVIEAKKELLDLADKLGNEKSRDIIIQQNLHRLIIGQSGVGIQSIRKDFPNVMINFPAVKEVSDIVTMRGNKDEVNKCHTYLTKYVAQLVLNNFTTKVHIFHEYHKYIIGKSGVNLKKICDETKTKINLPNRDSTWNDIIIITGLQKNTEKARDMLEAIQKEYADIKEETIDVPYELHTSMIGAKGALIRSISNNCGGVVINFPESKVKSNKVLIRGPESNVKKAIEQLLTLRDELSVASACKREIRGVSREFHPFLIGRGGANVNRLREQTGARIFFVTDDEGDYIQLIGTEEQVETAIKSLETSIKRLENHADDECEIDQKHHRFFLSKRGEQITKISNEFGGVSISFPKSDDGNIVRISGPKDCVAEAKEKLLSVVNDLESQVTIECEIEQIHHRSILSNRGAFVQDLTSKYNVNINFPKRLQNDEEENNSVNIITISGNSEKCEKAKVLLMARIPISKQVDAPYQFHRYIIGQKGKDLREFMNTFDVNVLIPPANDKNNSIKITGVSDHLDEAIVEMEARIAKLQFKADNEKTIILDINHDYHPKIIGRRGAVISKIRDERHVQIQFPDKGCPEDEINIVKVTGQSEDVEKAEEDIMSIVNKLESLVTQYIVLDVRIHARIIGQKGRGIRKIMEDFNVDVKFGRNSDEVSITGEEDAVLDCKDYLFNLEEEFMQDVNDYEMNVAPSRRLEQEKSKNQVKTGNFAVRNAPWTTNSNDFPAFGEQKSDSQANGWGRTSP